MNRNILIFTLLAVTTVLTFSQTVTITDSHHYSNTFSETRHFRIFLPESYYKNPEKRYPVIYFMHGWSQRYFGAVGEEYANMDKGEDNKGDNIEKFVSTNDVIVVKSDGYNRSADENYYVRPYNIGPVETFRQFPVYYPELISHIDKNFRTIPDRQHRAISGLSMGGFMTFWIGGKYPDLFCAAGSFCGSPEFIVGPKSFPVEYRHMDIYKNYGGMNVRLNYGDKDFIRYYHRDLNRVWTQVMDNYEYEIYDAAHSTCGLGEMFGFFTATFENPPAKPEKWHHIDAYPEFSIWDYKISTDRVVPGFTIIENVNRNGFRCSVREFLPDGELFPFVKIMIKTDDVYEPNQAYVINDIDLTSAIASTYNLTADENGSLTISTDGGLHDIGISKPSGKPEISVASYRILNADRAVHGREVTVSLKIVNKGLTPSSGLNFTITPERKSALIIKGESKLQEIGAGEITEISNAFTFRSDIDSIEIEKFKVSIRDRRNNEWTDFIEVPVHKDAPWIKDFEIADGRNVTVVRSGNKEETVMLGKGNGDGIANPGESIVILVKDQGKLWRTELASSDKYINPFGINIRKSDNWGGLDHVGGSAKYSVPLLSSVCPAKHEISFLAKYWLPEYPNHIIRQGMIKVNVEGQDKTSPHVKWVKIPDNIIQARIIDGGKIASVKAKLVSNPQAPELKEARLKDPQKSFGIELKDDGRNGDVKAGDNVFSAKIPEQKFYIFSVKIEAADESGNSMQEEYPENFIVY